MFKGCLTNDSERMEERFRLKSSNPSNSSECTRFQCASSSAVSGHPTRLSPVLTTKRSFRYEKYSDLMSTNTSLTGLWVLRGRELQLSVPLIFGSIQHVGLIGPLSTGEIA